MPVEDDTYAAQNREWRGRNRRDVESTLGKPNHVIPLADTGGSLLIYTRPAQPRYFFEIDKAGIVTRAAQLR